jgi:hypothetical protein
MKKLRLINKQLLGASLLLTLPLAYAGTPLWTFTPLTATTLTIPATGTATVQYQITNQSPKTHSLVMRTIPGISQVTTAGNCPNPFVLGYKQSCILHLSINGSALTANVSGGPVVCQQGNPNQCYQPSSANSLMISKEQTTNTATLSVNATATIPVNTSSGSLTVTNTSTSITAKNVHAVLPSSWTAVTQDASACTSIAPNSSCTLNFTATTPYIAQGNILVTGDNISTPPSLAFAFTMDGYLVWDVTSTSAQVLATSDASTSLQVWSPDYYDIGVNENSTSPCLGATDGSCDSGQIAAHYLTPYNAYAAGFCYEITTDNSGTVSLGTWYLPAICQMGGAGQMAGCAAGLANIDTNLVQLGFGALANNGYYWASTEASANPTYSAWTQYFALGGYSLQNTSAKVINALRVRCARSIPLAI